MGVYANKGFRFTDKEGETISIVGHCLFRRIWGLEVYMKSPTMEFQFYQL